MQSTQNAYIFSGFLADHNLMRSIRSCRTVVSENVPRVWGREAIRGADVWEHFPSSVNWLQMLKMQWWRLWNSVPSQSLRMEATTMGRKCLISVSLHPDMIRFCCHADNSKISIPITPDRDWKWPCSSTWSGLTLIAIKMPMWHRYYLPLLNQKICSLV